MEIPDWEDAGPAIEYPAGFEVSDRKRKRKAHLKREKELRQLIAGTVELSEAQGAKSSTTDRTERKGKKAKLDSSKHSTAADSFTLLESDPALFKEYHKGFQEQVKHWPVQPLDAAVAWVTKLPEAARVADFGCGEAQLATRVGQAVVSLDLVAQAPHVLACDMAHTPLETESVDAVVFCLALMGTDYGAFIAEAARVLKRKGRLWIAEVRSRFADERGQEDYAPFQAALRGAGFAVTAQDTANKMFVTFEAKKGGKALSGDQLRDIAWPTLKACQYKRR
ncbi:hypothetical protein WJX73_002181 [Symbiochloris irregularis]|uniref:Ribosomal RNA-processing protein 8 n=1 Tax=Symbiochloris irregularis TaxID=706552 RepID=A0AAW1NVP0_9CHLO